MAPADISTPRLRLSRPTAADARAMYQRYASDPNVTRYLSWPRHRSVADTEAFVRFSDAEWARWPAGPLLIRAREGGELLGGTGLSFEAPERAVTGYVFARDAWGRGYATEALRAMVDLARQLDLSELFALCHPDHKASQRVLEKCGFTRDEQWSDGREYPNLAPGVVLPTWRYVRHGTKAP